MFVVAVVRTSSLFEKDIVIYNVVLTPLRHSHPLHVVGGSQILKMDDGDEEEPLQYKIPFKCLRLFILELFNSMCFCETYVCICQNNERNNVPLGLMGTVAP